PELRKRYWGQHLWARGYFCATVGAVDEATIQAYIENQKWDEDDQGFKITAPTEPSAGFSRISDFQSHPILPALACSFLTTGIVSSFDGITAASSLSAMGSSTTIRRTFPTAGAAARQACLTTSL